MSELTAVGKILKPVGLRGEVKLMPLTADWQRLRRLKTVLVGAKEDKSELMNVLSVRIDAHKAVMKFDGVETEDAAETLRDHFLFVPEDEVLQPKKGAYFIDELIGAEVVTEEGMKVGVVQDVLRIQSNDVWSVWNGTREILIPAVRAIVRKVDIKNRKVLIHAIEGLLD